MPSRKRALSRWKYSTYLVRVRVRVRVRARGRVRVRVGVKGQG